MTQYTNHKPRIFLLERFQKHNLQNCLTFFLTSKISSFRDKISKNVNYKKKKLCIINKPANEMKGVSILDHMLVFLGIVVKKKLT
jgi:hypothetical protein